ncbi:addiction module protein [bacterium]|nr:addiction module protein [bacterium]
MSTVQTLTERALRMTATQRARLAHALIQSLDSGADADANQLWEAESARRVREIREGRVRGVPASKVFARQPRGRP